MSILSPYELRLIADNIIKNKEEFKKAINNIGKSDMLELIHIMVQNKGFEYQKAIEYLEKVLSGTEDQPLDPAYLPGFKLAIKPFPVNKEMRDIFVNIGCNLEKCGDAEILNFNYAEGMPPPIFIYEPSEEAASSK